MYHATGKAISSVARLAKIEGVPVERLVDEGRVLVEAPLVDARRHARAKREHGKLHVRQDDETAEPEDRRGEQQQPGKPRTRAIERRCVDAGGGRCSPRYTRFMAASMAAPDAGLNSFSR
jgi:hypothetical protein